MYSDIGVNVLQSTGDHDQNNTNHTQDVVHVSSVHKYQVSISDSLHDTSRHINKFPSLQWSRSGVFGSNLTKNLQKRRTITNILTNIQSKRNTDTQTLVMSGMTPTAPELRYV